MDQLHTWRVVCWQWDSSSGCGLQHNPNAVIWAGQWHVQEEVKKAGITLHLWAGAVVCHKRQTARSDTTHLLRGVFITLVLFPPTRLNAIAQSHSAQKALSVVKPPWITDMPPALRPAPDTKVSGRRSRSQQPTHTFTKAEMKYVCGTKPREGERTPWPCVR